MDMSNVFSTAGMVTGIGLLIVFTCLIALIVILVILPKVIGIKRAKGKKHPATSITKAAPAPEIKPDKQPKQPHSKEDYELVAVLSAAAAAMLDTQPGSIIIRSYKRVGPSAWKKSGRDYQIFHKF